MTSLALAVALCLAACSSSTTRPPARQGVRCSSSSSPAASPLQLFPARQGIFYVSDITWSPSASCLAVLGLQRLNSETTGATLLSVYDAHSATLLGQMRPVDAILAALKVAPGSVPNSGGGLQVQVANVLWSPDGQMLALPFNVSTSADSRLTNRGVTVVNLADLRQRVFLTPATSTDQTTLAWDLTTGTSHAVTLPPAVGYQWGNAGSLIPDIPLNATTPSTPLPATPIGNPIGSSAFSIWQPGTAGLQVTNGQPNAHAELPGVYSWATTFDAWSPDGRYLIDGIGVRDRIEPAGHPLPRRQTLRDFQQDQTPLLPLRDAGLQAIYDNMNANGTDSSTSQLVAWSPDGRLVLARIYFVGATTSPADAIRLYDTITGKRLALVQTFSHPGDAQGPGLIVRWSPDGSRLLIYGYDPDPNVSQGVATIWGAQTLR